MDMGKYPIKLKQFQRILLRNPERSPTSVALEVYDCKNQNVGRSIAAQNLAKLNITLKDLLDRAGLSDEQDVIELRALRKARTPLQIGEEITEDEDGVTIKKRLFKSVPDSGIRMAAINTTFRIKGKMNNGHNGNGKNGNGHVTINYNEINIEEQNIGVLVKAIISKLSPVKP